MLNILLTYTRPKLKYKLLLNNARNDNDTQESLLMTWINLNSNMDKWLYTLQSVGWNYLSIHKLQLLYRWSLEMDK